MKKGFMKKVAIATFALAALFMFNVTAVYANEATQEQGRRGGRVNSEHELRNEAWRIRESLEELGFERSGNRERTEREERVGLFNFREAREELGLERSGNRERTEREERIGLPNLRERLDELDFERSNTRTRTERESRSIRVRSTTEAA